MKRLFLVSLTFVLTMCPLFSQVSGEGGWSAGYSDEGFAIVSPVEGTWANRQPLVLEVPEGHEAFYSFSGSHPMESGFAYDGPVLIEADGEVSLRIALVFPDGNAAVYTVDYSVAPAGEDPGSPVAVNFQQPLVAYGAGQSIAIPAGFSYRLGNSRVFLPGEQVLSLRGGTFPRRYLPCEVTDGVRAWRFVLCPEGIPAAAGAALAEPKDAVADGAGEHPPAELERAPQNTFTAGKKVEFYTAPPAGETDGMQVQEESLPESVPEGRDPAEPPFRITDGGLLTFNRDKLIYAVDDSYWQAAVGSIVVDRSVGHTIYWQSVAYEKGNPVYSLYLPPMAAGQLRFEGREAVSISFGPDFTVAPSGFDMEPLPSLLIDAFYGEELRSEFSIDIYYQGRFQGSREVSLHIDKCPPAAPAMYSSSDSPYSRQDVSLTIGQFEEGELFYSLETLASEAEGFRSLPLDEHEGGEAELTADMVREQFLPYCGEPLLLESRQNHAHLFRVRAFAQDGMGNPSPVSSYSVIVDPVNYYVASADGGGDGAEIPPEFPPDGTLTRPFASLQQAVLETAHLDFVRLHIVGRVPVSEPVAISSNCQIVGATADSGLLFTGTGSLSARGGELAIKHCILERQNVGSDDSSFSKNHPLLSVVEGRLSLLDCEILGDFAANGTLVSATDAELSIVDSGVTLRAGEYGAVVSSLRSHVRIEGGRYAAIAPTAVVFSLSAGRLDLSGAECKVFGNLGRVAELTGVGYALTGNKFHGVFDNKNLSAAQLVPVWSDNRSKLIKDSGNVVSGFPGS